MCEKTETNNKTFQRYKINTFSPYFQLSVWYLNHAIITFLYYVDEISLTISLFNNSETYTDYLEFSQQIVKGYEFVVAKKFVEKDPFSQPKIKPK